MRVEDLSTYELIQKVDLNDINSVGYYLKHKKSGARVELISNDDDNKVFCIAFRTTPKNSTGVAHIMEHSVLSGSENFPLKDPFVELCKGSLNTFLNAFTGSDKTYYPVASRNDKDFQNLMHVYLDAVFHPNIYTNEAIFRQEGWHYELDTAKNELSINGVVYSEMKGALSSPDSIFHREISTSIYPDTIYANESGGDPDFIPDLSYEEFLNFHREYYHPSNSYIYLYGNLDMAEKLEYIDKEYLSKYDAINVTSTITPQKPFTKVNEVVKEYSVNDEEDLQDGAYFGINYYAGDASDRELYYAFDVLDYALCSAPGAPIKQALSDKGLGEENYSIFNDSGIQHTFSIISKGNNESRKEEFLDTVSSVLQNIVKNGFDKKTLLAGINNIEFRFREADYGRYPKGLYYFLMSMDFFAYNDDLPFAALQALSTLDKLKKGVDNGYFEGIVEKFLINNTHKSILVMVPKLGLTELREKKLKEKLASVLENMSDEEKKAVKDMEEKLRIFRETEDTEENISKLPLLSKEDLGKDSFLPINEETSACDVKILYHNIETNGIGYLKYIFNTENIPAEYFKLLGLFICTFGMVNTKAHTYLDLNNEISLKTGGLTADLSVYQDASDYRKYLPTFEVKSKYLYDNTADAIALMRETSLDAILDDKKRLYDILKEVKSDMESDMMMSGNVMAMGRTNSYQSNIGAVSDLYDGYSFFEMLEEVLENYDERAEELINKFKTLAKMIFRSENLLLDYTGSRESLEILKKNAHIFIDDLYDEEVVKGKFIPELIVKNEGFVTSGRVNYVVRGGNFRKKGLEYSGTLRVVKEMLNYDYLWSNIRVKGGAYGCGFSFGRLSGNLNFMSYRDPNLVKTIDVYKNAEEFLAKYDADDRTVLKYIIGAIGGIDTPMSPAAKGAYSLGFYLSKDSTDSIISEREAVLNTTVQSIRDCSKYMKALMEDELLCVVGSKESIENSKELFGTIKNLY